MRGDKKLTAGKTGWIIAGAILHVACSGSTDARDTTPPSVTSTSPANSASGVLINSVLTVTFSEAMIPSTINPGSVTLKVTASGVAVSGNMTYDATSHLATFTPSAPLDYDTGYTLTVTPAALDLAGNPLTAHYSATFRSIQRVFGKPYFQGTNDIADSNQPQIHVHLRFSQSDHAIGRPVDCERLPEANCDLLPRNAAGGAAIGTLDDQGVAATVTQISGTFPDPAISFTITLANGRTFNFSGTVTGSDAMALTMSGATLAPTSIVLSRGAEQ